MKEGNESIRNI